MLFRLLAPLFILVSPLHGATDGVISTLAGASTVDGVLATQTLVNYPGGIAADGVGNVYISDTGNHRIRRVDGGTGIISTIAGTGVRGFTGDNGPAASAQIDSPSGLSYVNNGTQAFIFFADTGNHRIRRVNLATGLITTVAGSGVATFGGDTGLAIFASFNSPRGLYADTGGNFYVADTNNHRIRRIDGISGIITTIAGIGDPNAPLGDGAQATAASLNAPETCLIGPGGLLYIADTLHYRIRSVNLGSGVINTAAGSGNYGYNAVGGYVAAASAYFTNIRGLYADPTYLFIADSLNHRIRYFDGSGVNDWFGTGTPGYAGDGAFFGSAVINNPQALTVDASYKVIFVDYSNNCVRKVDFGGTYNINTIAGSGIQDGVPATNVVLNDPSGVMPGPPGRLLISEKGANKIRSLDMASNQIGTFAGTGASNYSGDSTTITAGPATAASFFGVKAMTRDGAGNVYVADNYSYQQFYFYPGCGFYCFGFNTVGESRIRKIDSFGNITTVAGGPQLNNSGNGGQAGLARLGLVEGLAVSGTANLFLTDTFFQVLRRIDLGTGVISSMGGLSGTAGYAGNNQIIGAATRFSSPRGMAADSAGNLYIADSGNHVIRRVAATNLSITTICGKGPSQSGYTGDGGQANLAALFNPTDVYIDSANNIFVADSGNHRIRRIDAISNSISTVVGSGFQGFSGDGGMALASQLNAPNGVFLDPQGDIYVADLGNDRVRKVSYAQIPTPTPLVSAAGKAIAYPSPASDRICFAYVAPQAGKVVIDIYNSAMQLAARIEDQVASGSASTCGSVRELAPGAYIYKVNAPGAAIGVNKFKVIR